MMEARLLHARKLPNKDNIPEWQIINPDRRGIAVTHASISKDNSSNITEINADVMLFLMDLTGQDGPLKGWTIHAVGSSKITKDGTPTSYFNVVFVKDNVQGPTALVSGGSAVDSVTGGSEPPVSGANEGPSVWNPFYGPKPPVSGANEGPSVWTPFYGPKPLVSGASGGPFV